VAQGCASLFNGCKSLKTGEAGNRVFRFRGGKSPRKEFFKILSGDANWFNQLMLSSIILYHERRPSITSSINWFY